MDSTPTSHRPRRGRKALEKCSSTPIRAILEDSASNRTSPSVSPMDRANTSWLTPSTDKSYIDGNEQLTRSALRREFHLEEEDDYIMPCTQIVDPSANGEVFWNYNASPTTARARAALKERMSQIEEKSIKEDKPNPSVPSPVLRIPMLPIRKKPTSATKEDPYVKEQQNKKEVDEMLNSMKDILKAELQKHHNPPIDNENRNFVDITQETKNNSFGKDGLVSDDDSFILRATQVIGDSEHREKYNRDNKTNSHMSRHDIKDQPEVHRGEAFDDSDDFDFLLSQMEMPRTEPQGSSNSDKTRFSHNSVNRNIEAEDYNSRNGSVNKDKDSTSDKPKSNSTSLNIRLPSVPDKKTSPIIAQGSKNSPPSDSNSYFKRFKSASGVVSNIQQNIDESKNKNKTSTFSRRSYSTPDASSHNQLPGGRDMSVKMLNGYKADIKPKCTREEIELKRLEALKKREIERKRQEAIKRRQMNSQKTHHKS